MARKTPARWKQEALDIVDWLQRAEDKDPHYPCIAQMISCLNQLDGAFRKHQRVGEELRSLMEINRELSNYNLVPDLRVHPSVSGWYIGFHGRDDASSLVARVVYLSQRGLLWRVRRCAYSECRKWFLATDKKQHFHIPYCRERKYLASPKGKRVRNKAEKARRERIAQGIRETMEGRKVTTLRLPTSPRRKGTDDAKKTKKT